MCLRHGRGELSDLRRAPAQQCIIHVLVRPTVIASRTLQQKQTCLEIVGPRNVGNDEPLILLSRVVSVPWQCVGGCGVVPEARGLLENRDVARRHKLLRETRHRRDQDCRTKLEEQLAGVWVSPCELKEITRCEYLITGGFDGD